MVMMEAKLGCVALEDAIVYETANWGAQCNANGVEGNIEGEGTDNVGCGAYDIGQPREKVR